jgi:hypothetical protein
MKTLLLSFTLVLVGYLPCSAQSPKEAAAAPTKAEQEILDLSKAKWAWMAEKKADALDDLFDDKAVFVHMSGGWGKANEMEVIKSGRIWYKKAEIYKASVNLFGDTAILLNEIDLLAVVGGNEVINAFMVTEVYIKKNGKWKMGSLSFSSLRRPVKMQKPAAEPQK